MADHEDQGHQEWGPDQFPTPLLADVNEATTPMPPKSLTQWDIPSFDGHKLVIPTPLVGASGLKELRNWLPPFEP